MVLGYSLGRGDGLLGHGGSRREWAGGRRWATALESKATWEKTEEEEQWACAPTLAHAGERKREAGRGPGAGLRKKRSRPSGLIRERENFPFLFYFQN